jgi:transglutaminase-like putative cysteine protease
MHYSIRHVTRFTYDAPVSESVMEVRVQPRTELCQRCLRFELATTPRSNVLAYRDPLGNIVHHFDIPGRHSQLTITADAIVEFVGHPEPDGPLTPDLWPELDALVEGGEYWDFVAESSFARGSDGLAAFAASLGLSRSHDPLTVLTAVGRAMHDQFAYRQQVTHVDTPIEDVLSRREGVCQDFAHVMIAVLRRLGMPCRYVSGYLFHGATDQSAEGATHAWVEALLPGIGWVGFDPTNNCLASTRHVRVAIGRDYADVPPTRGVFRGRAASELAVAVQVTLAETPPMAADLLPVMTWTAPEPLFADMAFEQQQQQQQQ